MHGQSLYKNGNEEEIQAWPLRLRAKIEHDRARCRRNFTAPGRDKDLGRDKEIEATEMRFGITLVKLTLSLTLVKLSYHRYEFPAGGRAGPAAFKVSVARLLGRIGVQDAVLLPVQRGKPTCV